MRRRELGRCHNGLIEFREADAKEINRLRPPLRWRSTAATILLAGACRFLGKMLPSQRVGLW